MRCQKSKRAFTLVEMVIAIVVVAVVFSMVTIMSVSISGYSQEKTLITERHEEITRAQTFIKNWSKTLDDAFNTKFQLNGTNRVYIQSGLFWDVDPNNRFELIFDHTDKKLTGEFYINHAEVPRVESFKHIEDMKFTLGDANSVIGNTVKCEITMDDNSKYVILLEKESSKQGLSVIFNGPFEKKSGSNNQFVFVTSADWDNDLSQVADKDLMDIFNEASSDYSAAYHYAAMSMLRIQVDQGARMSLEAFATAYEATWKVSLFNAAGKIAYRMTLPDNATFRPSDHRLSFFIEEGSVLYDGTPVDAMGYTRKAGGMGTTDWHDAAELTFVKQSTSGNIWWLEFDTNIQWDEMDATQYTKLQYATVRKLYGMDTAFGLGIDDGIFITIDDVRVPLSVYANQNKVEVEMNNQGDKGTVRIRLGLNNLVSAGKTVAVTFTTKFHLPDGTPLREENTFLCKSAKASLNKAVSITAGGEHYSTSSKLFYMWFYVHTPWTDTKTTKYENLQDIAKVRDFIANHSGTQLSEDAVNFLYDRVFIGKDGAEKPLRIAKDEYKLNISLERHDDERMLLTFAIKESDFKAAGYPFNFEDNTFSLRFGANSLQNGNLITKYMILPNGTPVRFGALARIKGEMGKAHWLARQTMSLPTAPIRVNNTLTITISTNAPWLYQTSQTFNNVLATSGNYGFPPSFIQSLKSKVELTIGSEKHTLSGWGTNVVDVNVCQSNGCMAMQIVIKNGKANNKTVKLEFLNGFVGPDGTTLAIPAEFTGNGNGGEWESSTNANLFFPKRNISVVSTATGTYSASVTVKTAALNGTAPYYIYGRVKLENAKSLGSGAAATIKFDFASSADKTFTLYSDTGDWIKLTDLNSGSTVSMGTENVTITFQMYNMSGTLTVADLVVADKNGNIKYSMANDTTLYGVGDVRNVNNVNSTKSSWTSSNPNNKAKFPIITRGDSNYLPNRILKLTVPSGFTGEYANLLIDPKKFNQGTTYYITGRIRTTLSNNPSSNATNVLLSGAGTTQKYGVQNGEWVALAQPNGNPLTFTGGFTEEPKTTISESEVYRTVGIGGYRNASNAKMVFLREEFNKYNTPGQYVVHGYYKVTTYRANDGANGKDMWFIGSNTTIGGVKQEKTGRAGQGTWTYFRFVWDTTKDNLNFGFWEATGGLYIANMTIEDLNHNRKYDLSTDSALPQSNENFLQQPTGKEASPITKGYWYFYPGKDSNGYQNHCTFDIYLTARTTAQTPKQYTITKTDKIPINTISTSHRHLCMASSGKTINGKMSLLGSSFSDGTWKVHGYYYIDAYADITSDGKWLIGSGASSGTQSGKGTTSGYKHFDLTWDGKNNLVFEFWMARGGMYIANLVVEDVNGNVVYDMAKDVMIPSGYLGGPVVAPTNCAWWFGYSSNTTYPETSVNFSVGAVQTAGTPKWYYLKDTLSPIQTISSTVRELGFGADNNLPFGKMALQYDKVQAAYGNNTYIIRGYYKVTGYKANDGVASGGHYFIIGENATSGRQTGSANQTTWKYFELEWTPSKGKNIYFQFYKATGNMYLANLTIEKKANHSSSRTIVYQLAHDTKLVRLTTKDNPDSFPQQSAGENGIWYFHPDGISSNDRIMMDYSVSKLGSYTPAQYNAKWDYIKLAIGNNPGTVEIADLQIYYLTSSGSKVYVYRMSTDSAMATNKNDVNNTNNTIGSTLWPYTFGSQSVPFKYSIINNNISTPPDTDFVVPKFTETAG